MADDRPLDHRPGYRCCLLLLPGHLLVFGHLRQFRLVLHCSSPSVFCLFLHNFFSGSYSNQCLVKLSWMEKPGNTLAGVVFSFHPGPHVCQIKIHSLLIYIYIYGCVCVCVCARTDIWIYYLSFQVLNAVMFIEILGFHI